LYDKCKIVNLILYVAENFSFIQHNNILQEEVLKAKVSNLPDCFMISIHVLAYVIHFFSCTLTSLFERDLKTKKWNEHTTGQFP
jgi:hypothetical protein